MGDEFCSWYGTLPQTRKRIGLDVESLNKTIQDKLDRVCCGLSG